MNWFKKLIKRKVMGLVIKYVVQYVKDINNFTIDELDAWIDEKIKEAIKIEWIEELALDLEQVIIDDVIKYFLPDIKAWVIKNIKLVVQNAQNQTAIVQKMSMEIGDELYICEEAEERAEEVEPEPEEAEEKEKEKSKKKKKK